MSENKTYFLSYLKRAGIEYDCCEDQSQAADQQPDLIEFDIDNHQVYCHVSKEVPCFMKLSILLDICDEGSKAAIEKTVNKMNRHEGLAKVYIEDGDEVTMQISSYLPCAPKSRDLVFEKMIKEGHVHIGRYWFLRSEDNLIDDDFSVPGSFDIENFRGMDLNDLCKAVSKYKK